MLIWISHGHTCAPPNPEPHLPPHPIPLGCPRALALSVQLHASNLHWSSILYMLIYMFQYDSLITSHPHLLPHSSIVCSLHLCLFCCIAYRIIVTIFLNSIYIYIYALIYCISVSLSDVFHSVQQAPVSSTALELTQMDYFLQLSNIPFCICTTTSLSIHLLMDIQAASMSQLSIINSAAVNIGVHVSLSNLVSLVCIPSSGIVGYLY